MEKVVQSQIHMTDTQMKNYISLLRLFYTPETFLEIFVRNQIDINDIQMKNYVRIQLRTI